MERKARKRMTRLFVNHAYDDSGALQDSASSALRNDANTFVTTPHWQKVIKDLPQPRQRPTSLSHAPARKGSSANRGSNPFLPGQVVEPGETASTSDTQLMCLLGFILVTFFGILFGIANFVYSDKFPGLPTLPKTQTNLQRVQEMACVAFMFCVFSDSIQASAYCTRERLRIFSCLLCINTCEFALYLSMVLGWVQPHPDVSGQPMYLVRYLSWSCTTPVMLVLVAEITNRSLRTTLLLIAADLAMLWLGFVATVSRDLTVTVGCFSASSVLFVGLMYHVHKCYLAVERSNAMLILDYLTIGVWTSFPIIWLLSYFGITNFLETEVLYACADVIAKFVYSVLLSQTVLLRLWTRACKTIVSAMQGELRPFHTLDGEGDPMYERFGKFHEAAVEQLRPSKCHNHDRRGSDSRAAGGLISPPRSPVKEEAVKAVST